MQDIKSILLNKHIKVNKMSDKSKKSLKSRSISSIFIVLFLLLSLVFCILSDTKWHWFPINNNIPKQIFSYLQMALMGVVVIMASLELTNLHFYKNNLMTSIIVISMILCTYGPSLIYVFQKFNYFAIDNFDYLLILSITFVVIYVFVLVLNVIMFWVQGLLEIKKLFIHTLIMFLVSLFVSSWIYISFFKGWTTLLIIYCITALTDVFAYISGMFFGKKKMSPYISPNKTIGGGVGGVLLTLIIVVIIFIILSFVPLEYNVLGNFFGIKFNDQQLDATINNNYYSNSIWWWCCVICIVICMSIICICGDLSYSYIKRLYSIKDFSNLIPGHGGMLDRIDSLTFVVPSYFIFIMLISYFSSTMGLF